MPAARRQRASSPMEADEDMEDQEIDGEAVARLQFNKPLTWKAGKPITVSELLKRLETLSRELQTHEQDEVARESMTKVAAELANPQILTHKDRGVRAYAATCLVDIFRLCAPDAPYTAGQIKDIFTMFVTTVFPALADPSSTYSGQHLYVLKSLAEVKSIIVLTDVPASGKIMETLFKQCFDVLGGPTKSNSGEELSKNVEHHMTAILSTLVEEAQNLPSEVVETILAQFLRTSSKVASNATAKGKKSAQTEENQSTLLLKEAPPAYNMAKNVCNASPDRMGRYVARYFNAVLLDASTALTAAPIPGKKSKKQLSDELDDSDDDVVKSTDLGPTQKVHDLLRELWRSTPSILQEIIPQQIETELSAENVNLRVLAVETVSDMISGIGHAGPPPPSTLNPAAYPPQSVSGASDKQATYNFLTTPSSPVSFISRYFQTYQEFVNRRHDRSPVIRAAWATGVGRILMTSAGGVGLDSEEEEKLITYLAQCLIDVDERVRFQAIQAVEQFGFEDIVGKLGSAGGISEPDSLLSNLAQRVKDKKQHVRSEAIRLLGKIWGVAVGAIAEGDNQVASLLSPIPSNILEACYVNDTDIHALVDRVLYESLLPLGFPPIKSKPQSNGNSQRVKDSQPGTNDDAEPDPDKIRTERFLFLIRDLEPKAKPMLFSRLNQQTTLAQYMSFLLDKLEAYNGGVVDDDKKETKKELAKFIDFFANRLPDSSRVSEDLWKFAKLHDRRAYQLIRFCIAADSDYRKIQKSVRELTKKIEEASGSTASLLDTLTIMIYRCSPLVYNRSHVPAIIDFSRTDEKGLGNTAHEVLNEISKNKSEVFKAHVQDLCKSLVAESPTSKKPNGPGAVSDLKACAEFARKFPADVPKERKFMQAMLGFVSYGTPVKAAKYGVLIIMSTADRKEMYAKDIFKQCTQDFNYGEGNYLARLAALSQLMLLGPQYLEESETDVVVDIAINRVLTNPHATPAPEEGDLDPDWTYDPDENCTAKVWALKILVNRLRGYADDDSVIGEATKPVFQFLNTIVQKHGQISRERRSPAAHQSRMRMVASQLLLKLCREKRFNQRLTPTAFNSLSTVAMDPNEHVRSGFVNKIMKYLGRTPPLHFRFYTPLFLLGHEPDRNIKDRVATWLRSRASMLAKNKDTAMESIFARLLSLLAHHPDWLADDEDENDSEEEKITENLTGFMGFIIFYLKCVGTRDNLSLIYHIAQRVKSVQDGIVPADKPNDLKVMNERLYMLSDLSQEVIRIYEDINSWNLQAWPGKVSLPAGIFSLIKDHDISHSVAMKSYLPGALTDNDNLENLVKNALKTRKRKFENADARAKKRSKVTSTTDKKPKKIAKASLKTPKKKRAGSLISSDPAPSSDRRKSSRAVNHKSYIEISDDEKSSDADIDVDEDEDMPDADAPEVQPEVESEKEEESSAADPEPSSDLPALIDEEEEEVEATPQHSSPRKKATPKKTNGISAKKTNETPVSSTKTNGTAVKAKTKAKSAAAPTPMTNRRPSRAKKEQPIYDVEASSDEESVAAPAPGEKSKAKAKAKPTPKSKIPPKALPKVNGRAKKSKAEVWDVPDSDVDDG